MKSNIYRNLSYATAAFVLTTSTALSSSHREAPLITETPKLDATDFYMFRSYEAGREGYVTIIANYIPLQDPYGGPNYFTMDPDGLYEIHIDNDADAVEDLTFQFKFTTTNVPFQLPVGMGENQEMVPVPLINVGQITAGDSSNLLREESYNITLVEGPRRTGTSAHLYEAGTSNTTFIKPVDNIGNKSLPDYAAYANQYIYNVDLPGTDIDARVFVGQKKDPFVVNLGETFDLVNISTGPVGNESSNVDTLKDKNVTSIIIEIPIEFLITDESSPTIGAWTTASMDEGGELTQVSRLGQPLVNEVVIGLPDKDLFNSSVPADDGQFAKYVTHPTLPVLLNLLFDVEAPEPPRNDLVAVFLTGVADLNQNGSVAEMLRLNTSIAPTPKGSQNNLGVVGGDLAGFPNGRRPGDDVVDIALRAVMGVLLDETAAPAGQLAFTDGASVSDIDFPETFPYLNDPLAGSPNDLTPGQDFFKFAGSSVSTGGIFFYDYGFASTLYTSAEAYPNFYVFSEEKWVWWFDNTLSPRHFYDYEADDYFTIDDSAQ
jgi:hypothetical protein